MSWLEPLVEVETGGERIAYGPVTPDDVDSLFAAGLLAGKDHPLCQGPTRDIPYLAKQDRWTFRRCGLIDPLSLDDYRAHGGFTGLQKAFALGPAGIREQIKESGLRGRGGAGFPTGIKWQTVADAPGEKKYIACNADEGDSGTFSDRMLMEGDPFTLIEGMLIAGLAVGADYGYVYLRSEYPLARSIFSKALCDCPRGRLARPEHRGQRLRVSTSSCISARVRTSAAKKQPCWRASKDAPA
jgi:formate dehydrogenase iron-sulfur subunit